MNEAPALPPDCPEPIKAGARWQIVGGNPPHAPYVRAWVVRLGRRVEPAERDWLRSHGFRPGGAKWTSPWHEDRDTENKVGDPIAVCTCGWTERLTPVAVL